jgi:hypothetical protein
MFHLLLILALSQTQHDKIEYDMYGTLQRQKEVIADIWHPSKQLLTDYAKAQACYTAFHLYKTESCTVRLSQVDVDLLNARKEN